MRFSSALTAENIYTTNFDSKFVDMNDKKSQLQWHEKPKSMSFELCSSFENVIHVSFVNSILSATAICVDIHL